MDHYSCHMHSTQQEHSESADSAEAEIWSGFHIRISELIGIIIRVWMSAGLLPKCIVSESFRRVSWVISPSVMSHFAECHKNQPVTEWEMLINLLKTATPQWWEKWKSGPESVSTSRRSSLAHAYHVWSTFVSVIVSYPAHRLTDQVTPPALASNNRLKSSHWPQKLGES